MLVSTHLSLGLRWLSHTAVPSSVSWVRCPPEILVVWRFRVMSHRRSLEAKKRRRESREERRIRLDKQRGILLQYSFHDLVNGEIVHTVQTEGVVYAKLKIVFGEGFSPVSADFGQVLNRFGL